MTGTIQKFQGGESLRFPCREKTQLFSEIFPESVPVSSLHLAESCGVCLNTLSINVGTYGDSIVHLNNEKITGSNETIRVVLISGCKHVFHYDCLKNWIKIQAASCPVCTLPFSSFASYSGGGKRITWHYASEFSPNGTNSILSDTRIPTTKVLESLVHNTDAEIEKVGNWNMPPILPRSDEVESSDFSASSISSSSSSCSDESLDDSGSSIDSDSGSSSSVSSFADKEKDDVECDFPGFDFTLEDNSTSVDLKLDKEQRGMSSLPFCQPVCSLPSATVRDFSTSTSQKYVKTSNSKHATTETQSSISSGRSNRCAKPKLQVSDIAHINNISKTNFMTTSENYKTNSFKLSEVAPVSTKTLGNPVKLSTKVSTTESAHSNAKIKSPSSVNLRYVAGCTSGDKGKVGLLKNDSFKLSNQLSFSPKNIASLKPLNLMSEVRRKKQQNSTDRACQASSTHERKDFFRASRDCFDGWAGHQFTVVPLPKEAAANDSHSSNSTVQKKKKFKSFTRFISDISSDSLYNIHNEAEHTDDKLISKGKPTSLMKFPSFPGRENNALSSNSKLKCKYEENYKPNVDSFCVEEVATNISNTDENISSLESSNYYSHCDEKDHAFESNNTNISVDKSSVHEIIKEEKLSKGSRNASFTTQDLNLRSDSAYKIDTTRIDDSCGNIPPDNVESKIAKSNPKRKRFVTTSNKEKNCSKKVGSADIMLSKLAVLNNDLDDAVKYRKNTKKKGQQNLSFSEENLSNFESSLSPATYLNDLKLDNCDMDGTNCNSKISIPSFVNGNITNNHTQNEVDFNEKSTPTANFDLSASIKGLPCSIVESIRTTLHSFLESSGSLSYLPQELAGVDKTCLIAAFLNFLVGLASTTAISHVDKSANSVDTGVQEGSERVTNAKPEQ